MSRKLPQKINRKNLKPLINKLLTGIDIFFADAKSSFSRVMSLFSALFWTWLEFSFLVFFFTFAFGIAGYVTGGSYEYSIETLKNNKSLIDTIIKLGVLIIFILRVPMHYKKEVKKRD